MIKIVPITLETDSFSPSIIAVAFSVLNSLNLGDLSPPVNEYYFDNW